MMELIGAILAFFIVNWIIGIVIAVILAFVVGFFALCVLGHIAAILGGAADENERRGRK